MHHRWKIAWSCALQEWRQLASHSRNLKNCPQVPAQRWTVSVLIYPVNCKEKKNPQNQKYFVPRGKNFTLYIGGLIAWDPTDPSVHTSQSGEWKILTAPSMENFDGLALQGSHTIYHTLPHITSLQGSHAWGVFARRLVELYPDRLRAIQHLGWRERADKVILPYKNMVFKQFSGGSCNCCQVSPHLWSIELWAAGIRIQLRELCFIFWGKKC